MVQLRVSVERRTILNVLGKTNIVLVRVMDENYLYI